MGHEPTEPDLSDRVAALVKESLIAKEEAKEKKDPAPPAFHPKKVWKYAVAKGRCPTSVGVYNQWSNAAKHVLGVSGAAYAKFRTAEEGWDFIRAHSDTSDEDEDGPVFYAVAQGRDDDSPGVYTSWDAVAPHVEGIPGAIHWQFGTEAEAWDFVQKNSAEAADPFFSVRGEADAERTRGSGSGFAPRVAPPPETDTRHLGPDESKGKNSELFGAKVTSEGNLVKTLAPKGVSASTAERLAEQTADVVGLPGTSATSGEDRDMSVLARSFQQLVEGKSSSMGGQTDTTFKSPRRTSLAEVKDLGQLKERISELNECSPKVLETTVSNLTAVYMCSGLEEGAAH